LTTIVGIALWSLASKKMARPIAAGFGAILVVVASAHALAVRFVPLIKQDFADGRTVQLARFVRAHTQEDQALLIVGLDWSSEVPYYAVRRSVAVSDEIPPRQLGRLLDPKVAFGNSALGSMIVCPKDGGWPGIDVKPVLDSVIRKYALGRKVEQVAGCQVYY
ncbi:MAG TPA: hypothetical protein VK660_01305, partial [Xanthomonadaceae bacterium]|nr:hypothetical protein [Xanthomonadaceae bacterium]